MTTLISIFLLGLLVAVHELGHALAARTVGVEVRRLSLGFGPPLWKRRSAHFGEVAVGWIPLGGYCRLAEDGVGAPRPDPGERWLVDGPTIHPDQPPPLPPRERRQRAWRHTLIALGGPAANLLFAYCALVTIYLVGLPVPSQGTGVGGVLPGSAAAVAGFEEGDRVVAVAGQPVATWEELQQAVAPRGGQRIEIQVERQGSPRVILARPRRAPGEQRGVLGLEPQVEHQRLPPLRAFTEAAVRVVIISREMLLETGSWLLGRSQARAEGPVGIVRHADRAVQAGPSSTGVFLVLLNLMLAVFNLLPLPALDGSRALLRLLEATTGFHLPPWAERAFHAVGMLLLLLALGLVSARDLGAG